MKSFSKSKLVAYRQCPKRFWLEFHRPELRETSAGTEASFQVGYQVGNIAQRIYDRKGKGVLLDLERDGYAAVFQQSQELLESNRPVFEAGFSAGGAYAFADILLPAKSKGQRVWRMVEVKSSSSVKDYHRDDAAIQAFAALGAGVPLQSIALAHIDTSWIYPGGEDYDGLLVEEDLTAEAFARGDEVADWVAAARKIVARKKEPEISIGKQCGDPYPCGFAAYCQSQVPQAEYPIEWLPGKKKAALEQLIEQDGITDLRDVPDDLLNDRQLRVKRHSLSGKSFFDKAGAAEALSPYGLPAYFLDFETIQFAVPIWKGTRPYQQIPFQFSVHRLGRAGKLEHDGFLDLSGDDPSKAFAEHLIAACGQRGPIFVYNAGFEGARIRELGERFPRLKHGLLAVEVRFVDLLPVVRDHFYDPIQQGSWSIKKVLPAIVSDLRYDQLEGVQDGGMAMESYLEAIQAGTDLERKKQIEDQLVKYCELDTYAMVRIWRFLMSI